MLLRTLPLLNDDEFEQVIVTLFRPGQLAAELRTRGVRVLYPGGLGRLLPLLRALQPSLVITYLFHADMIGRLFVQPQMKVPVIAFLRTTYNFSRYLPARIAERLTRGLARQYLANSEAVKNYYIEYIGVAAPKVTVLPNGIDVSTYDTADAQSVVDELCLPRERFVISCVANLARNKGHAYLLEAFEGLASTRKDLWLLIVGAGEQIQALQHQVADFDSKDRILFLGRRQDVPAILAASDLFVLPTLFEGMSNAIQEAMAARLPVVTTDIPENRTLIAHLQNGLLVAPGEADSLRAAIDRILTDRVLRRKLGSAARSTIEQQFRLSVVAEQWRQLLRTLAAA